MKLKTIRVRRSRPSAPALALALALTMLCVYLLSLPALPGGQGDAAPASAPGEAELRMEGMEVAFICEATLADLTEARIAAANCAASGGAGMLLGEGGQFAVVREAAAPGTAPEGALKRAAAGLTLRLSGPAAQVAAVSDAVGFLRAQASETGDLAAALEAGDARASSLTALLEIYRTQGARARDALADIGDPDGIVERLRSAVQAALDRLESALESPDPGKLRLIHAAACAEWLRLLGEFSGQG